MKKDQTDLRTDAGLTGQFLLAMPGMGDERFERSLIYLHNHDGEGAIGFVVNKDLPISMPDLFEKIGLGEEDSHDLARSGLMRRRVRYGGPVEEARGFVLMPSGDGHGLEVSSSMETLHDIASGRGPEDAILVLGYAGWGDGQLEREIAENAWMTGVIDPALIFRGEAETLYGRAFGALGIDPGRLSGSAGHA